jgi:hypothetical protein
MARPVERGHRGTWSLVQVAAEAGITRGVARTAVLRGYLPAHGYAESDVVLLKVAAVCLAMPDPSTPIAPKNSPEASRPGRRDAAVLRYTRAIIGDSRADPGACVMLAGSAADAADRPDDILDVLTRLSPAPVTVLPVGAWCRMLPSRNPRHRPLTSVAAAPVPSVPSGAGSYPPALATPVDLRPTDLRPTDLQSGPQPTRTTFVEPTPPGEPW